MSYIDDHPTNFNWRPDVRGVINRLQKKWPWKTYINTYYCHPPGWCRDRTSFDVWGGGMVDGVYRGYRGKPLDPELGKKILDFIFEDPNPPNIWWIIYRGKMWTRASGVWGPAPPGPADSDPGHWKHIHVTYLD